MGIIDNNLIACTATGSKWCCGVYEDMLGRCGMQMTEHIKAIDAAVQAIAETQLQGNDLSSEQKAKLKVLADTLFVQAKSSNDPVQVQASLLSGQTLFEEEMSGALTILNVKKKVVSLLPQRRRLSLTVEGETAVLDDALSLLGLACKGKVHLKVMVHARVVLEEVRGALLDASGIDANDDDLRDANLFDVGLTSLERADFVSNLQDSFPELKFPTTLVFDYQSAAAVCDFIENEMSRLGFSTA